MHSKGLITHNHVCAGQEGGGVQLMAHCNLPPLGTLLPVVSASEQCGDVHVGLGGTAMGEMHRVVYLLGLQCSPLLEHQGLQHFG